jgi:hypothetical protein
MHTARLLPLMLIGLALTTTACESKGNATLRHGTIEIRRGVPPSSLQRNGVLGISRGTSASRVLSVLGTPFAKVAVPSERETCWAYRARQPGTSIDALDFCINHAQRVARIVIGVHL